MSLPAPDHLYFPPYRLIYAGHHYPEKTGTVIKEFQCAWHVPIWMHAGGNVHRRDPFIFSTDIRVLDAHDQQLTYQHLFSWACYDVCKAGQAWLD
jgi:hypothetical protein